MLKRITGYILLISMYVLCGSSHIFAAPVSEELALKTAENWLKQITGEQKQSVLAIPDNLGIEKSQTQPAYYIVSMEKTGWAIVAGDDNVDVPIIGYSPNGKIDPDNLPPAFQSWMEQAKEQILIAASENKKTASTAWKNLDATTYGVTSDGAVAPLLKTTWNQGKYYNSKCPVDSAGPDGRALVGCCATALAQVMKYHNWPSTGKGSNSYSHEKYGTLSANFGATTYNWSSMPSSGGLTSYNDAAATLLYHAGIAVNMNYGSTGSYCNASNVATALSTYFKYKPTSLVQKTNFTDAAWKTKITTDIYAGRPVYYRGTGTQGGHAFVCDGVSGVNSDYFHFNWGWGGGADGYFYLTSLTPGSYNFGDGQAAIFGIEPDSINNPPAAATLISPSGSITNTKPTFRWNAVSGATWYAIYVLNDTNGKAAVNTTWLQGSSVCSGTTCSLLSPITLTGGNHRWWIRTWNSHGNGLWSTPMSFHVPGPPAQATLISPSDKITNTKPTFTWKPAADASWYLLYVYNDTSKKVITNTWLQDSSVCSGTTCSLLSPVTLTGGNHRWWIQTWNSSHGYGLWSTPMSFHLLGTPEKVTLNSPSGNIANTKPTFTWSKDASTTWYYLYVRNTSTGQVNALTGWKQASSICATLTCSVASVSSLAPGSYEWYVRGWNQSHGYGPSSDSMAFHLSGCYTGPIQLISPTNDITNTKPTFTWTKDADANWYYLYVLNRSTGQVNAFTGWKWASSVCSSTTCSVTPTVPLTAGFYSWWVQPYSSCGGHGKWSEPLDFQLGFHSFDGNAGNWYWRTGYAAWHTSSGYNTFYTIGQEGKWATSYYGTYLGKNTQYDNFDYEAKMYRTAGDDWAATGIALRGDPLTATDGYWTSGYQFTYSRDGRFSVWQMQGANATALVPWTLHSAINKNTAWNTLRVRAVGTTLEFYINNIKVATVTNATIASGKVGLMMYRQNPAYMVVDYAKLTPIQFFVLSEASEYDNVDAIVVDVATVQVGGPEGFSKGVPEGHNNDLMLMKNAVKTIMATELVPENTIGGGNIPQH
jgi:hypothetical protein